MIIDLKKSILSTQKQNTRNQNKLSAPDAENSNKGYLCLADLFVVLLPNVYSLTHYAINCILNYVYFLVLGVYVDFFVISSSR